MEFFGFSSPALTMLDCAQK